MNKITSTLAGLAIVASASVVPAFAQGNLFSPPGTFSFTDGGTFSASGSGAGYNPIGGGNTTASFTLTGTSLGGNAYKVTSLVITPAGLPVYTLTAPLNFTLNSGPAIGVSIASIGAASDGTTFNLVQAVPEASTVVSFGALLALGGLAVLRRKSVKNAA